MRTFKNLFFLMLMALVMFVAVGCGGSKIELSYENPTYTIEVGKEEALAPTVKNEKDEEFKLVFTSADDTVVTYVDGKIKGVAVGETKVKVTLDGNEKIFAEVTVKVVAAKKFKVTFNVDGGSAIAEVEVTDGGKVAKPGNPTKAGFAFAGWYTSSAKTTAYDFNAAVTAAMTLYAKWDIAEYDVTFDVDGGSEVPAVGVNHGDKVAEPADPTKENHQFLGWFSDEAFTTEYDFDAEVTSDLTIYAKWELNTYQVTFNTDGGSSIAQLTVAHGAKVVKPADPTKADYIFKGWYKEAELTTEFNFDTEVVAAALTIYAKWEFDMTGKVSQEFELNGGSFSIFDQDFFFKAAPAKTHALKVYGDTKIYVANAGTAIQLFPTDAEGLSSTGWAHKTGLKLNADGFYEVMEQVGGSSTSSQDLSRFDYVLVAHDSYGAGNAFIRGLAVGQLITITGIDSATLVPGLVEGTINVYPAGAGKMSPAIVADKAQLPSPTKADKVFAGWYTTENFTGTPVTEALNGKVYAKFDDQVYNITYEFNGGAFAAEFLSNARTKMITDFLTDFYNFLELDGVTLETFMHGEGKTSGYEGLYFTADNFAKLYAANNKSVDASTGLFINQPEYNKWVPLLDLIDEYTHLNPDQSFWASPSAVGMYRIKPFFIQKNLWGSWIDLDEFNRIIVEVPEAYLPYSFTVNSEDIVLPIPVKADHNFLGWYTKADFSDTAVTKIVKGTKGDVKLYANFELITFDVKFESNEGSAIVDEAVAINEKATKPANPTRDGYMFNGWFTDAELTIPFDFDTPITADVTLYAAWVAFEEAEVDYNALVNEERETYYIKVTVPGTALLESDIKSVYTFIAAGQYVTPQELAIVAGDPYLWFGVAKLDGDLGLKENGLYAYKVVRQDDTEFVFSFEYDKEQVTGLPTRVDADIDYKAILNEVRETYYIKVSVAGGELLDAASIKSIRAIKEAGVIITSKDLIPDTDTVLWFGVADLLGLPTLKDAGLYAYEVVKQDDTKYVLEFNYDPELVTDLPEIETASINYDAVWNAERSTWYIEVSTEEDLDSTTVKNIYAIMKAGAFLDPEVALTPDADKVLWFGVAVADGQLTLKEAGAYMYRVVRLDDSEYVFGFTYDPKVVTGILYDVEFESNGGSTVTAAQVEIGTPAVKPEDPTKEGYTFAGWFSDQALSVAFDWEANVTASLKLYAKWDIIPYTMTYELNGGEYENAKYLTKKEMADAFFTDLYEYINPEGVTLEQFMHIDASKGLYDGKWKDYTPGGYSTNWPGRIFQTSKEVDETLNFFINQPAYNKKWLPLFNMMESFVKGVNSTQKFWGDPYVGGLRLQVFLNGTKPWSYVSASNYNMFPAEYTLINNFNIQSATFKLPTDVKKEGLVFLGWYDNAEFDGEAITSIPNGSFGNKTVYAKFVETVLTVTGEKEITVGNSIDLTANITATWTSSDETVATVDANGKVTAIKAGNVTITATSADKQVFEVAIVVYGLPTKISFRGPNEFIVGGTGTVYGLIEAGTQPAQNLQTYVSSDSTVFTVNELGVVTAVGVGQATLTITSTLVPTVTKTQNITVLAADSTFDLSQIVVSSKHVENESLYHNKNYVMGKNGFTTLQAALAVAPENAKIYVLNGTYADAATVTQNGLTIYGVNAIITGTITVQTGVTGLTVRDLDFTGKGQVVLDLKGGVNDFTFTNNHAYDVAKDITVVYFKNDGTAANNNIVITNNIFEVVKLTALEGRYVRGGNTINLTISNNIFKGLKANYVDAVRLEGNNETATTGIGMAGIVKIENNEFVNIGQRAVWLRRYSATEVTIKNNLFDHAGDQTYGGAIQLENWVAGQTTAINVSFNTFKNIIATFALRINNANMAADVTWKADVNYNKFHKLNTVGTNFYIQAYSEAAKGLINADYNFFEVAPTDTVLLAQVGTYANQFATAEDLDAYDPLGEVFYETDLEAQTAIAYTDTAATIADTAWTIKQAYLSIPGDTNGDRVNAAEDNLRMLRLRGANVASIETTNFVAGLKNFVFDAKYYNASHNTAVMKVSKLVEGGEWVEVATITLTDSYVQQVVEINETGNVKVRIDVTVKSANIDNIKFYK